MTQQRLESSLGREPSLLRQRSTVSGVLSRGNSFISRSNSFYGNGAGLHTEGTIAESITIVSVQSPFEEGSGVRVDNTKYDTRAKPGRDFSSRDFVSSRASGVGRPWSRNQGFDLVSGQGPWPSVASKLSNQGGYMGIFGDFEIAWDQWHNS